MLTVQLQGGLGNQLFQLAFLDYCSLITGKQNYINSLESPRTVHSNDQYYETIFKKWKPLFKRDQSIIINENPKLQYEEWSQKLKRPENLCLIGYFQRYEYTDLIKEKFIKKLSFDGQILQRYPDIQKKVFIHVRGGDYIGNPFHHVDLKNYYRKCMDLCKGEFVIFTNDIRYSQSILPGIPIIQESELDTLYLMSQCAGCICANSSFSWWGAYLNTDRPVFFPSKWYNFPDEGNYYFKGAQIIDVNV